MKGIMTAILSFSLSMAAYSDEVRLTNGHMLKGISREEAGRVIVEMTFGTVSVPQAEVQSIVPGRTLLHEYMEYASALGGCPDACSTFDLALWAQDHGLTRQMKDQLHRTIDLDPEHEQARTMLGYVCYNGKWMTGLELKKALGWVEVRGLWVAPKEPDAFCASESTSCGVVQPRQRVTKARRTHAPPEGVPYTFGIPAYSSKGTHHYGSGGYLMGGGVLPTHTLMTLPIGLNSHQ